MGCSSSNYGPDSGSTAGGGAPAPFGEGAIQVVYHCTTNEACESILRTGFRFPTAEVARRKGLKLGAAVYFGEDPDYCVHEALNTFAGDNEEARRRYTPKLGLIQAHVRLGRSLSLGDYDAGCSRGARGVSAKTFERMTEGFTRDLLRFYGYDTVTIFEGRPMAEVAIYDAPTSLVGIAIVDIDTARAHYGALKEEGKLLRPRVEAMAAAELLATVYHCTRREACESIVGGGFRFPTEEDAHAKGLKLGAAVYFGEDPEYCKEEALNTLAGDDHSARCEVAEGLGLIRARVRLGRPLSLGDFGTAVGGGYQRLSARQFEDMTEGLTHEKLQFFGYDTISINEGTRAAEVAVYSAQSIVDMEAAS